MGDINISSENQSGGITAHTVASGNAKVSMGSEGSESKARGLAFWLTTGVTIVAGVVGVAAAFHWL